MSQKPILPLAALAATSFIAITLSACGTPKDEPREVCVQATWRDSSRGGVYQVCTEYAIQCLKPLKLDTKDGKLVCRLRLDGEAE
jgi:hypothetical protein